MIKKYLLLFIIFTTLGHVNAQTIDNESEKLSDLISQWEHRDGASFISISFELTKIFLKNDSLFLEKMYNKNEVFNTWVDKLQAGVFTAYEAGNDCIEKQLYVAFYEKLKNMMLEKITLNNEEKYYTMLRRLKLKLNEISIKFID